MLIIWPFKRHGHWIAWAGSIINILFLAGITIIFSGVVDLLVFFKTVPIFVKIIFLLPWVSLVTSIWMLYLQTHLWQKSNIFLWKKIHNTGFNLATLVLIWMAYYWNLILL